MVGVTSVLEAELGTGNKYELACASCSAVGGVDAELSIERLLRCVALCFPLSLYLGSAPGGGVDACCCRYREPFKVGATIEESDVLSHRGWSNGVDPVTVGMSESKTFYGSVSGVHQGRAPTDRHSLLGFFEELM